MKRSEEQDQIAKEKFWAGMKALIKSYGYPVNPEKEEACKEGLWEMLKEEYFY